MELNILILCHRKQFDECDQSWNKEATVATNIVQTFVDTTFGKSTSKNIDYLVDNHPCNCCFKLGTYDAKSFVQYHKGFYDIVLFYTYPVAFMLQNKTFRKQLKTITRNDTIFLFGYANGLMQMDYAIHEAFHTNIYMFIRKHLLLPIYSRNF